MCGISGAVFRDNTELSIEIETCALLQGHRGPDYFGQAHGNNYRFYHNRLSILDTSSYSNQPIQDQRHILLYNGEIYNYIYLYKNYIQKDNTENTSVEIPSDSWVLFELLKKKNIDIVTKLNGMFAFSFFDKDKNELILCRDRMGIKPLYYSFYNNIFCFASELKTVLCMMQKIHGYQPKAEIDQRGIDDLLALGHTEFQQLPFRHISELKPGHILRYTTNSNELSIEAYNELHENINAIYINKLKNSSEIDLIDRLDKLLQHSVKQHLVSDVPVATLCSGGVDSSLITALAVKYNPDISIYHAGVKGGGGEEAYAEQVARHLNIHINYIEMDAEQYFYLLPDVIYHGDFPVYHPSDVSLFAIADKARQEGIKVLLCGEGADELFGGYGWHKFFLRCQQRYGFSRKAMCFLDYVLKKLNIYKYADILTNQEFINYTPSYLNYFTDNFSLSAKRNALIRNSASWTYFDLLLKNYTQADIDHPELAAYISHNLYGHLDSLLRRNDRMCMMASIEARVPFIENDLVSFALNLPTEFKIKKQETKYLLKKVAERYIPYDNVYRKKSGFPVPWEAYLQKIPVRFFENGFLCQYLNISYSALKNWLAEDKILLGLSLSIEIWGRIFVFGESTKDVKENMALLL
jgi:asparagine synthase (glutamine-hydrolysing)